MKHLYSFIKSYFQRIENIEPVKRRGRPKTFEDALILTLWLYQTLYKLSYREVLEIVKHEGFHVPVLGDYHYRVKKLDEALEELPRKPFIADKGYDAVDVIERVMKFGCEPAIGMKQSWRMRIRNWLRRMSFENWERYRKRRYRIEGVFGSMKLKVGSSFTLVREDLAKKMAIACAIVWNLYMIVLHILCYFVMVLKMVRKGKVL